MAGAVLTRRTRIGKEGRDPWLMVCGHRVGQIGEEGQQCVPGSVWTRGKRIIGDIRD